jgi:DNA-binding PadR family transcriptional regulator
MERGVLRYILLAALKAGPKHGYQMIKWVEERTHGLYSPSPGTIYPTLQYLEDQGLVRAESQEERRVYHLTDAGRAELEANGGMVEAVIARFNQHAPAGATGHEAGYLKAELLDLMRTVQEGVGGAVRGGDEETVRRVRQAVERCKNEVRDIIARAAGGAGGAGSAPGPAAPGGAAPAGGEGEAPTTL